MAALRAQREVLAQSRRYLDAAQGIDGRAAGLQARARRLRVLIVPVMSVLIAMSVGCSSSSSGSE